MGGGSDSKDSYLRVLEVVKNPEQGKVTIEQRQMVRSGLPEPRRRKFSGRKMRALSIFLRETLNLKLPNVVRGTQPKQIAAPPCEGSVSRPSLGC